MTARHEKHLKTTVKRAAQRVLVLAGASHFYRAMHRNDTIVLAYHNVVPDHDRAAGDSSLHLSRAQFVAQIEALARTHEIVPLVEVLNARGAPRCRAAITFDDAYIAALEDAIPDLARRGIPATVFVAPGLLGAITWWDATADAGAVPVWARERALKVFAGDGDAILGSGEFRRMGDNLSESMRIGTLEQLYSAARHAGIHIGSHTWTHSNLAMLAPDAVERELASSRDWLRARFPSSFVPWLSYPYGLSSRAVQSQAARIGYAAALRVDGGWCTASSLTERYELPR